MPKRLMASQSSLGRVFSVSLVASILHWEQTIRETSKVWRIDPVKPKNGIQTTTNQAQQKGRHIWRGERLLMSAKGHYVVINSLLALFFDSVVKRPIERWGKEVFVSFETKSTFENFALAHSGHQRIVPMSVFVLLANNLFIWGHAFVGWPLNRTKVK
jgi:hypothetical protein